MNLAQKKCTACVGDLPALSPEEIKKYLTQLKNWQISAENDWIFKEFKFKDFLTTLEFVKKISVIAEQEQHHPNIDFTWGYCKVSIQTHKIKGLAESDFVLAAKIDEII
jgi:4a-hydroxytetrahydrobiopterin dehydratase